MKTKMKHAIINKLIVLLLCFRAYSQYDCKQGMIFREGESMLPSWCNYKNPFSSYPDNFFFVDPNFTFSKEEYCSGPDPYDVCQCVVDIHYVEFDEMTKNLMFFLKHGKIVYSDYVSHILNVLMDLEDDILYVSPILTTGNYKSAIVLASKTKIYFLDYHFFAFLPSINLCKTLEIDPYLEIKNTRMVNDLNGNYYAFIEYKMSDKDNRYKFDFIPFDGSCSGNFSTDFTWEVTSNENSKMLEFDIITHYVNLDHTVGSLFVKEASSQKNVLFLLNDGISVHIVPFKKGNYKLDMGLENQLTKFYQVTEGNEITHTSFIGYEIRKIKFNTSKCGYYDESESQPFSLIVVEYNSKISIVRIVELQEMFEKRFSWDLDFYNYANRSDDAISCLETNQYYDELTKKCVDRNIKLRTLDHNVETTTVAFISTITNSGEQLDRHLNLEYFCSYYMKTGKLGKEQEGVIRECLKYNDSFYKCDLERITHNSNLRKLLFSNFWYTNIFLVSPMDSNVDVFSYGYDIDESNYFFKQPFDYFLNHVSNIQTQGHIAKMLVTRNSYYSFLAINRFRWEIDSQFSQVAVCKAVKEKKFEQLLDKDHEEYYEMLRYASEACTMWSPHLPTFNDFAFFLSSCPKGIHCLSMRNSIAETVERGYFSLKPFFKEVCPPGYYCVGGEAIACPKGFYCDKFGLSTPKQCTPDPMQFTSCWFDGTINDHYPCPPGTICTSKYSKPIPVPGGFKQNLTATKNSTMEYLLMHYEEIIEELLFEEKKNGFVECDNGEWCPVGVFFKNPCPAGTYCTIPNTVVPSKCSYELPKKKDGTDPGYSDYCPEGTYNESNLACPAGYYCQVTNKTECSNRYLCEKGSLMEIPCLAGYYCPTPQEKILCPANHFCPKGSVFPKRCSFFSICPPGSRANNLNILDLLLILSVFVGVYTTYFVFKKCEEIVQRVSEKKRRNSIMIESSVNSVDDDVNFRPIFSGEGIRLKKQENLCLDLACKNLRLTLKSNGKVVVNDVTAFFESGTVTAVMGLSGCGKTSIITTLAGKAYYGRSSGDILVNGVETKLNKLKKLVGFVPQEDVMWRMMSVKETLSFSARTRCKKGIDKKVVSTLELLGLDSIQNERIGDENVRGISGGQRKRVNIGIELVSDPIILFLDEPTSGLDSSSSSEVCDCLKRISSQGVTVICVIHQPRYEIFSSFDNLLLLGTGGSVIYAGAINKVESYFQKLGYHCPRKVNLADFILDVCSGRVLTNKGILNDSDYFISHWKKFYENKLVKKINENKGTNKKQLKSVIKTELKQRKISFFVHFFECLKRGIKMRFRDLSGFYLDNGLIIFGGLILGALFSGDTAVGQVFPMCEMISLLLGLCGIMGSLSTFGDNTKVIFIRENQSGLSSLGHFLSFNIVDIFNNLLAPLNFCFILFFLAAPKGNFWMFYLITFAIHFTTYGLGYCVSIIFQQNSKIASIVVLVVLNFLSGLVTLIPQMGQWPIPLRYFCWGSYVLYATQSLYLVESKIFTQFFNMDDILATLGYDYSNIYWTIPTIFAFGILFRIVSYILLLEIYPLDSLFNKSFRLMEKIFGKFKYFISKGLLKILKKIFQKRTQFFKEQLEKSLMSGENFHNEKKVEKEIFVI